MVYINKGEYDNPYELPKDNSEGSLDNVHHDYTHADILQNMPEEMEKFAHMPTLSRS